MARGTYTPEKTEVVVTQETKHTIELSSREAQVLRCILAHTVDIDPKFPEVAQIYRALKEAGAPDHYDKLRVLDSHGARISIKVIEL